MIYQHKRLLLLSIPMLILLHAFMQPAFAQPSSKARQELESKKEQLLKEIEETNRQLKLNEKNQKSTKTQLNQLNKQIRTRESLIRNINSQISNLGSEIDQTSEEIETLEAQMTLLKNQYATMLSKSQRKRSQYNNMMYIFASADFYQAVKRIKYVQQYTDARRLQAFKIDSTQVVLNEKKEMLLAQRNEKSTLKSSEEQEKKSLTSEKKVQESYMTNLNKQEETLKKQLATKQEAKRKLESAIAENIRKEIEAARKRAEASGKKKDDINSKNAFNQTPEEQKLTSNFSGNRGSLPWPVESGEIVSEFGEHQHPVLKNITVKNDGVDIQSPRSSQARAIFNGEVTGVINLPGSYTAVIVRHGEYLTVYSNLEGVVVRKGDKVTTKQKLGTVHTDAATNVAEINFQIWKGYTKLDPKAWLKR
ncbi:MAG: peptidoglycan DD-metalloendopeptidase family protein [Bacteroidetes bacterium]|nr:peptidoglycan DD-metalloendopeptidase family protein [Bacteroidota bacterium]